MLIVISSWTSGPLAKGCLCGGYQIPESLLAEEENMASQEHPLGLNPQVGHWVALEPTWSMALEPTWSMVSNQASACSSVSKGIYIT
jgi:hypothetical protein